MVLDAYISYVRSTFGLTAVKSLDTNQAILQTSTELGFKLPHREKRPYSSVHILLDLRHQLIHGSGPGEQAQAIERQLQRITRSFELQLLMSDLEEFLEDVHQALRASGRSEALTQHALRR